MTVNEVKEILMLIGMAVTAIVTFLSPFVIRYINGKKRSCKRILFGVFNCSTPDCLSKYPDFTSVRKWYGSAYPIGVLHVRTLSYALRHCDFVIARVGDDPKIIQPDDIKGIENVIPRRCERVR